MPIKKSAVLLLALATGSVSLLVFSAYKIMPSPQKADIKCCQQLKENEQVSPWSIVSQSMFRTKA